MTAPLANEHCPRCEARIFRAVAQAWSAQPRPGGEAPDRFAMPCPNCRAALTIEVLSAAPVAFRLTQTDGGQP